MKAPIAIIPEQYRLSIAHKGVDVRFTMSGINADNRGLEPFYRKLYVVIDPSSSPRFLYVGEANCSIKVRFQRSFSSYRYYRRHNKARGGYKGYKWIEMAEEKGELEVLVIVFEEENLERAFLKAIEGELVYRIRKETSRWPLYQHEIHFYNENEKDRTLGSRQLASHIWTQILKLYPHV